MTATVRRNQLLVLGLICAWLMSSATAPAQVDQQSKKAGGADSKSSGKSKQPAAKDEEAKGMGGMSGMGGMT
ncbi:MAG TPA: hypothetical protein VKI17_08190 [Gemmataceae bacterium]|nr:hypothetical protein [Gemmataceae bacterium]